MNENRRMALTALQEKIQGLRQEIEQHLGDEQEYFDNMPENFQSGEKGEKSQTCLDAMQEAIDGMESVESNLGDASA